MYAPNKHRLTTGRKYALIKKYALNTRVRLLTRLYGMLKRIGVGALLTTASVLSILLIDSTGHSTKTYEVPCFHFSSDITLNLSPYFLTIQWTLRV